MYSTKLRTRWLHLEPPRLHSAKLHACRVHVGLPGLVRPGRMHCQVMADKPGPSDGLPTGSPDISMLSPQLQRQWHVKRNMHLGATKVTPQSSRMAVWQCDKCPAGQPHIWIAKVANRTAGTQCPYCANRLVCLHNSLATLAPEASRYWNHTKNESAPEQVLAGTSSKAEWQCPDCKCEWRAGIRHRARAQSGCPKCSARRCKKHSQPSFAEAQPPELAEWDHERNTVDSLFPHKVTLGSIKQVHWICSCCPKGQPHRWTASPNNRIGNGSGCAVCAGKQACVCNSLESLFPSVAAEFDVDKNGFPPSEITAWSNKEVYWRNANRGTWRQAVDVRTDRRWQRIAKQGGM